MGKADHMKLCPPAISNAVAGYSRPRFLRTSYSSWRGGNKSFRFGLSTLVARVIMRPHLNYLSN